MRFHNQEFNRPGFLDIFRISSADIFCDKSLAAVGYIGLTYSEEVRAQSPNCHFTDVGKQICDEGTKAKHKDNKHSPEK